MNVVGTRLCGELASLVERVVSVDRGNSGAYYLYLVAGGSLWSPPEEGEHVAFEVKMLPALLDEWGTPFNKGQGLSANNVLQVSKRQSGGGNEYDGVFVQGKLTRPRVIYEQVAYRG